MFSAQGPGKNRWLKPEYLNLLESAMHASETKSPT
jgi:hypothetical protein